MCIQLGLNEHTKETEECTERDEEQTDVIAEFMRPGGLGITTLKL